MPAANYHFRNYYVYSMHDLDKYEQEIKDVCRLLNMRAYCSVNYKMMSQVALDTTAECARRIAAHDYKKFYQIFESCSGKYVDRSNARWIVDVDDYGTVGREDAEKILTSYIDTMESGYDSNVIYTMPTRSGFHLITHPFNLQKFNSGFGENITSVSGIGVPDIKKNHVTLLFEDLCAK